MRTIPSRLFEEPAAYRRAALAIAVALGLGCADGSTGVETTRPPSLDVAVGGDSVPVDAEAGPPGLAESEAVYRQLRKEAESSSAEELLAVDGLLRAAESEFPLEFRFSYERAKLVVFGRHEHHEAFGRLRRAAEKAIETGRSEAMLEMLRSDGARGGPFWKLARGHSEWRRILAALEHRDREALWHEHHETRAAIRVAPDRHAEVEAHTASRTAASSDELHRLRLVRARIAHGESAARHGAGHAP
jgi:hypothetical protein